MSGLYKRPDSAFWYIRITRPGLPPIRENTHVAIDARTADERKAQRALAEQIYRARLGDLARQRYGLPEARPTISWDSYASWYKLNVSKHKRSHLRELSAIKALSRFFRRYQLHQIGKAEVLEWRTWRVKAVQPQTVNRELDTLKHMLSQAVPKYLEQSPIAGLPRLRVKKPPIRIFTEAEEARLLKVLDVEERAIMLIARDTLMRLSDVKGLRWEHDKGDHLLVVDPKVEPYEVPISPRLRLALDALPKLSAWLFPRRQRGAGALSANTIQRIFVTACQRAEVPQGRAIGGVTFHSLRHTGATRLLERGASIRAVQEAGGWQSLKQLERYAHVTPEARQKLAALAGDTPETREPATAAEKPTKTGSG